MSPVCYVRVLVNRIAAHTNIRCIFGGPEYIGSASTVIGVGHADVTAVINEEPRVVEAE